MCDGTNGTPDLRNRFIYGGNGTNNGNKGGEAQHTLSVKELPVFQPTIITSRTKDGGQNTNLWHGNRQCVASGWDGPEKTLGPVSAIGGGQPHNNMPPYYTLAYIMKL